MAIIAVSFKIREDESKADYDRRYKAITDKIKSYASGSTWEETTSFYLFESIYSAAAIAQGVFLVSEFRASKEIILAINTSNRSDHAHYGAQYPNTLNSLLSKR